MQSNDPSYTDPALEVIREDDPDTYRRMQRAPWQVRPVPPGEYPPGMDEMNASMFGITLGQTGRENTGEGEITWLNEDLMSGYARDTGLPIAFAVAETMVHEFAHTETEGSQDERGAFRTELGFARRAGFPQSVIREIEHDAAQEIHMTGEG